jgi:uncharacterized protein (DUF1499 family)
MPHRVRRDLRRIELPRTPNAFLVAPEGYCLTAKPHMIAPEFPVPMAALWRTLLAWVAAEPRVTVHDQDKAAGYLAFTQRSRLFRFPDRVYVEAFDVGVQGRSTVAIYSHSVYGRSDLGVNKARVLRVLAALEKS